jgi:DNA-binding NarL/FixJ family response regulator
LVSERARINKKRGKAKLEKNLTDKEFEVMELLQKKYTIDQICEKLKIAKTTLRTHRSNVRNKLGASNNYDCLIILELWGWLPKSTFVD